MIDFEETQKMVAAIEIILDATQFYTDVSSATLLMKRYRPSVVMYGQLRRIGYSTSDATDIMKLFETMGDMKETNVIHLMRIFKYGMDKGVRVNYMNQNQEVEFHDISNRYTSSQMEDITSTIQLAIEGTFTVCC
jgi:hypothetical protein